MPFRRKPGSRNYTSPSGRVFTPAQVRLYYATNGFKNNPDASSRPDEQTRSVPDVRRRKAPGKRASKSFGV